MKSRFPVDITLEEVRLSVKGRAEFVEKQCGDHVVISYYLGQAADGETFPDPMLAPDEVSRRLLEIRRECRGIIFSRDGKLLRRGLHKFFNIGELKETEVDKLDFTSTRAVVTEKLDGSMVSPFETEGKLRFGSRMGVTDTSVQVEQFLATCPRENRYEDMCWHWLREGYTCVFEWCSPINKIVLDYDKDRLELLAIRSMRTGDYFTVDQMRDAAAQYGVPCVQTHEVNFKANPKHVVDEVRSREGIEGFVIRFEDVGLWYKTKTHWYFRYNKLLDKFYRNTERIRWQLVLENTYDDLKPFLPPRDRRIMDDFIADMMGALKSTCNNLWDRVQQCKDMTDAAFGTAMTCPEMSVLWKIRKGVVAKEDLLEPVVALLKTSMSSKKTFDVMRSRLCPNVVVVPVERNAREDDE